MSNNRYQDQPSPTFERRPGSDTDHTDDMAIDEENLGGHFENQDLEALLAEAAGSEISERSSAAKQSSKPTGQNRGAGPSRIVPKWMQSNQRAKSTRQEEEENDVPASLMLEEHKQTKPNSDRSRRPRPVDAPYDLPAPVPGPATSTTRAQWESTRRQQQLHGHRTTPAGLGRGPVRGATRFSVIADPKERARWKWAQVENLDGFLNDVYAYYVEKGIYSMLLRRIIMLLTSAFVLYFLVFVTYCIDYTHLSQSHQYSDIRVQHCGRKLPLWLNAVIWLAAGSWIYNLTFLIRRTAKFWEMHNFYHYLLGIPDKDMQSVSWQYVVRCLMDLRDQNLLTADRDALSLENRRWLKGQSKQRMDAHDIANRLMRQENYWIAIINRDILNYSITIPLLGKRQFYTKTLEYILEVALTRSVFDPYTRSIKAEYLSSRNRATNVQILQRNFRTTAILSCLIVFFAVPLTLIIRILSYFTEYQKNPASLGAREWSSIATWKLREFNELDHFFFRRKKLAKQFTDEYLEQFPRDKTAQSAKFVSFVCGALLAYLGIITLADNELFLGFEIAGKTVLFWIGLLTGLWNMTRGLVPADDIVHDPEFWIEKVIECTHYKPKSWEGKLFSEEVLRDMGALYKLELFLFLEEIASIILVPYIFWSHLPACAEQLVDFYREFTIHVDGLGHVCSFAVFDFKNGNTTTQRAAQNPSDLRADYFGARDNKLAESYQTFMLDYGDVPRKGLGNNRNKRAQFHHPPVFPGLAASRLQQNLAQSMFQPQRAAANGTIGAQSLASPMQSVLLDPHHQPRVSHQSPRQGPQLRQRIGASRLQALDDDPDEHDEDLHPARPQRTPSNILEEDSDLGESWAVKADAGISASGDKGAAKKQDSDVGVLGLLYQFQRAQTDGRGLNM